MNLIISSLFVISLFLGICRAENNKFFEIDKKNFIAVKIKKDLLGNVERGKKIFISRKVNCLSCHEAPIISEKFQGNFGPPLGGIGSRYNKEELRLRVIDSKSINPDSIMPSYFKKIKFERTPAEFLNKTILSAQEVEDLVEYLYSLK